jgi:predicted transposase/invertase (TIGR01784 family)
MNQNKLQISNVNIGNTKENKPYNLKNDVIFKTFFSRKGNEIFLIDFLEALLKIKIEEIQIKEEVNLEKLSIEEKGGRLDLQAKLNDGIVVNIELQIKNNQNIEERTTYYSSKVISRETKRGSDYQKINKVIMINILDYELLGFDEYISETAIVLNKHREYEVLKGIKWYFIELPKFRKQNPNMNEKINQWLVFLDDYNKEAVKLAEEKNDTLKKARIEMNYLTGDEEVRRLAELREKWEMDRVSEINFAKLEIAKKMLKKGMDIDTIIELTGLTKKDLEEIS